MQNYKTRPRRADEDDEEDEIKSLSFQLKATPIATAYTVHIDEPFVNVKQFENIVTMLEKAGPNDVLEIKLSTPGGALHAILPLVFAMGSTNANVFVHAVSDVASAGTFLLMMADDVFINPYVTVMFHQVSFGASGQGNHVGDFVDHVMKSSKKLVRDMYSGFLTETEIEALLSGKEFWMDKTEFDTRYAARTEQREAQMNNAIEAALASQEPSPQKPKKVKVRKKA